MWGDGLRPDSLPIIRIWLDCFPENHWICNGEMFSCAKVLWGGLPSTARKSRSNAPVPHNPQGHNPKQHNVQSFPRQEHLHRLQRFHDNRRKHWWEDTYLFLRYSLLCFAINASFAVNWKITWICGSLLQWPCWLDKIKKHKNRKQLIEDRSLSA